jgi:hypothetical protein
LFEPINASGATDSPEDIVATPDMSCARFIVQFSWAVVGLTDNVVKFWHAMVDQPGLQDHPLPADHSESRCIPGFRHMQTGACYKNVRSRGWRERNVYVQLILYDRGGGGDHIALFKSHLQ